MADRSVVVKLRADIGDMKAKLAQVEKSVDGIDKAGRKTEKGLGAALSAIDKNSASWNQLGTTVGRAGLVIGAGVAFAVKKFADFDKEMSAVAATGQDAQKNLDGLRDSAIQAGAQTVFSASEAAAGIEELAKAGVSASDIMGGGLKGSLDLAAAGAISVGDAAGIASTAMTQFNLSGKDVPHIADLLAAGAGKAQGGVDELGMALKQGGLVAAQFGLSVEDTVGTLTAFASAGLLGSDAGTSFKQMLLKLANPSKQAAKTMEELGINTYDAGGNFVGITGLAGQLQDKLGGLSQAQRNAALSTIFGSDAIRAASILYDQGAAGIQGWIDKTNDSGYAAQVAAKRMDNLSGDLENLGGSLETVFIKSGSGANDVLRSLAQGATTLVNSLGSIPEPALRAGLGVAGVTAAVLLLGGGAMKAVTNIAAMRTALTTLKISAKGAGLAAAGVGVALGLAGLAYAHFAKQAAEAKQRTDDFVTAMQGETDAIAKNTRAVAAKQLQDEGAFKAAKELGLSVETVTDAALGNATAMHIVQDRIDEVNKHSEDYRKSLRRDGPQSAKTWQHEADAAEVLYQTVGKTSSAFKDATGKAQDMRDAMADTGTQTGKTKDALLSQLDALKDTAKSADDAEQSFSDLTNAMFSNADAAIQLSGSQLGFKQAILDATDAVDKNKKELKKGERATNASRTAFDLNTQAGIDNKGALDKLATSAHAYIKKQTELDGSTKNATKITKNARDEFVRVATKMGLSKDAAGRLADEYGLIPKNVRTSVSAPGADRSKKQAEALKKAIKNIPPSHRTDVLQVYKESGYNAALDRYRSIRDKTVTVRTSYTFGPNMAGGMQMSAGATGGLIDGPYQGPTADNVIMRVNPREYIQQVSAVDYYGVGVMDALNARKIPKTLFSKSIPGLAGGGQPQRFAPTRVGSPAPQTLAGVDSGQIARAVFSGLQGVRFTLDGKALDVKIDRHLATAGAAAGRAF